MTITEEIEKLAVARRSSDDIERAAVREGMIPLRRDGLEKVLRGLTSLEEVLRVVT